MTAPLFYQRLTTLDRALHAHLQLRPMGNLLFAAGASLLPLLSAEFARAAREYPIVFVNDAENGMLPVAVTGLPGGPNLHVDDAGQWHARYVPAYVRRYPFLLAQATPEQLTVCIDEACPGLVMDGGDATGADPSAPRGTALFDASGEPSAPLQQTMQMLLDHEHQGRLTQAFVQRLQAADLLMEARAQAQAGDGRRLDLQGFWIVDEARLRALSADTVQALFASGELAQIHAHLLSLANLSELLRQRSAAAVACADAASGVNADNGNIDTDTDTDTAMAAAATFAVPSDVVTH